jgi:hypothetical protein
MDVKMVQDVRFKRRGSSIITTPVRGMTREEVSANAYVIERNHTYTLLLRSKKDEVRGENDSWVFQLLRKTDNSHNCDEAHRMGRPRLTLSTDGCELNAYGLAEAIVIGGGEDKVTLRLGLDRSSGCEVCRLLFLRVDHYSCNSASANEVRYIPLVIDHAEE